MVEGGCLSKNPGVWRGSFVPRVLCTFEGPAGMSYCLLLTAPLVLAQLHSVDQMGVSLPDLAEREVQ